LLLLILTAFTLWFIARHHSVVCVASSPGCSPCHSVLPPHMSHLLPPHFLAIRRCCLPIRSSLRLPTRISLHPSRHPDL
jgi:hypothetical protein